MMQKQRLNLEYPLSARKPDLLWQLLSTDHGLERWLAEERQKNSHIKLQWVDEDDPDAYWEMRIGQSELTEELCLCVVDYAPAEDIEDLHELWDDNLDRLHQSSGF